MFGSTDIERTIGGKPRIRASLGADEVTREMCSQKSMEDRILVNTSIWGWPERSKTGRERLLKPKKKI